LRRISLEKTLESHYTLSCFKGLEGKLAEPLRKMTPKGELYRRRDTIEVLIDQLDGLPRDELIARMVIVSPKHPDVDCHRELTL
jgi:hypothetical protein